jgi:hypothetical protein
MMRLVTIAIFLAALAAPDLAAAQVKGGGTGSAPVGHRQPSSKELPSDPATPPPTTMTKQDRALDRALKGICRGC